MIPLLRNYGNKQNREVQDNATSPYTKLEGLVERISFVYLFFRDPDMQVGHFTTRPVRFVGAGKDRQAKLTA